MERKLLIVTTSRGNRDAEELKHDVSTAKNIKPRHTHINDITPRDFVEVCLDMRQMGVGGFDSWGAVPDPQYLIPANKEYQLGIYDCTDVNDKSINQKFRA